MYTLTKKEMNKKNKELNLLVEKGADQYTQRGQKVGCFCSYRLIIINHWKKSISLSTAVVELQSSMSCFYRVE